VVDFDGGENFHLFIHEFANGIHQDMTPGSDFALQPNYCWSPDGREIAFISDQSGVFDAYIMPAGGGTAHCVMATGRPVWDVHWSPDGVWLAVTYEASGQDYGVSLVSLKNQEVLTLAQGDAPLNAYNPCWSPDGRILAFHSDAPNDFHQIGLFDLDRRAITWLTDGQANHLSPNWSPDGSSLAYVRAQGTTDILAIRAISGQTYDPESTYAVDSGVHYRPRFTPDGKQLLFLFNNPRLPPDLWKLSLAQGQLTQLVTSLPDEMDDLSFSPPQEIHYPGMDGTPVPALLYATPEAGGTTPAVVVVHGGPNWHYQMEWQPFMTHLASRGWAVLAPNYRGSTGYGRAWQYANRFDLGGIDTQDIAAGAKFLAQEQLADRENIAVTGRSHGGYLTLTSLTQFPECWAAGSGVVPFANWFTCHARSRGDLQHWDIEMMGDPAQHHERWRERSPYFYLDRVQAPVQLICGAHDPRCPAEDSVDTKERLLEFGKQVEFHLYEDEGHAFLKTENVIHAEAQRVEFLARHFDPKYGRPDGPANDTQ